MKKRKIRRPSIIKERDSEDWCFICKDGGDLMICEYSDCLKVYHPVCVGKGDSSSETGKQWTCACHYCFLCRKVPKLNCYSCPNAVCGHCIKLAEFAHIRGKKGLCSDCLELVLVVEEKENLETETGKIDLKDRNTYECLFLEYWDIIKEKEGLTLEDIYSADVKLKKGQFLSRNIVENKVGKRNDDADWTAGDMEDADLCERVGKKKGSKEFEFVGWGSKPLIDFLQFLGKDTKDELSQYEVESIIGGYIQQNKLLDPGKRKRVLCDEMLFSIFRRKCIQRNRVYDLLEDHFVSNMNDESDHEMEDADVSCFDEKMEELVLSPKRRKAASSQPKLPEVEPTPASCESCFASIIYENLKLVYLRRSLVEAMLNEPDNSKDKLLGSFVKIKNDHRDYTQRNAHQISQVAGLKNISTIDGNKSRIVLRLASIPFDIPISMLSDFDICEEEIEDLRLKVEEGLLPRPTVVNLEQKARHLHEDITKHWIQNELMKLQKLVDFANEKGRRRELEVYLEERELLKKPSEQQRRMQQLPKITAQMVEQTPSSPEIGRLDVEVEENNEASEASKSGESAAIPEMMVADGKSNRPVPSKLGGDHEIAAGAVDCKLGAEA